MKIFSSILLSDTLIYIVEGCVRVCHLISMDTAKAFSEVLIKFPYQIFSLMSRDLGCVPEDFLH